MCLDKVHRLQQGVDQVLEKVFMIDKEESCLPILTLLGSSLDILSFVILVGVSRRLQV
jgi:hypothetical protein